MIIVGTAGHIDHGKTALTRSLTGIETDRLKEEQQRGISIELGFAFLDLASGMRVGLIDVPGHERFVHHMIAGATGVDLVVLVVAADEGIMPQTREHVAICQLLGMKTGMVVVTKVDLVDPEWLELVKEELAEFLAPTFLANAPVLDFSALWAGDQLAAFKSRFSSSLEELARTVEQKSLNRPFMMPVDRVFTIKGFGTVVTGTVQTGTVRVGDFVRVLPGGRRTKVRRVENHGQPATEARSGTRSAINVPDIARDEIERGAVLVGDEVLTEVDRFTAVLRTVPNLQVELKTLFKALCHIGSTYVEAFVRVLDGGPPGPDEERPVGIRLARPVALIPGTHFILRGFFAVADYGKTLGGGTILWPDGIKARPENLEAIDQLRAGQPPDAVAAMAFLAGLAGLDPALLAYLSPLPTEALLQAAATSPDLTSLTVGGSRRLLHRQHAETIAERIIELLRTFHEANPRQPGMAREELKSRLPAWFDREVSAAMADRMVAQGVLKGDELTMACADFEVHFDQRFAALVERAEALLRAGGMTPPLRDELRQTLACDDRELTEVVTTMQSQSRAVKISADVILHADAEEEARKKLVAFLQERGTISTQELKELWGVSRKYLIPLAEYYDASRLTARVGESQRKLRRG